MADRAERITKSWNGNGIHIPITIAKNRSQPLINFGGVVPRRCRPLPVTILTQHNHNNRVIHTLPASPTFNIFAESTPHRYWIADIQTAPC